MCFIWFSSRQIFYMKYCQDFSIAKKQSVGVLNFFTFLSVSSQIWRNWIMDDRQLEQSEGRADVMHPVTNDFLFLVNFVM